jgi:hypothetical protein
MSKPDSQLPDLPQAVPALSADLVDDASLMAGSSLARHRGEIEDLLHSLPDRPDLQKLYERNIPLEQILQLLGHQVDSHQIEFLLRCEDPRTEIRRILGSA